MRIITEISEANYLLSSKYSNLNVQVWMFGISHKRLALRLKKTEKDKEVVYLVGVSCDYVSGSFFWENSNLCVSQREANNLSGFETLIVDSGSGFKLITSGGFALIEGNESEFGSSFEDFFNNAPV